MGHIKDLSDFGLSKLPYIKGLKVLWSSQISMSTALSWPGLFDRSPYSLDIDVERFNNININIPCGILSSQGLQLFIDIVPELPSDPTLFRNLDAYSFKCTVSCTPKHNYDEINGLCSIVGDIIASAEGQGRAKDTERSVGDKNRGTPKSGGSKNRGRKRGT
jgi:hypothetical protein